MAEAIWQTINPTSPTFHTCTWSPVKLSARDWIQVRYKPAGGALQELVLQTVPDEKEWYEFRLEIRAKERDA